MKFVCLILLYSVINAQHQNLEKVYVYLQSNSTVNNNGIESIKTQPLKKILKKYDLSSKKLARTFSQQRIDKLSNVRMKKKNNFAKLPDLTRLYTYYLPKEKVAAFIKEISALPEVGFAKRESKGGMHSVTSSTQDPDFNKQWHLDNNVTPGADINILEAWQIFQGSTTTKIGIFDTGVSLNHNDLVSKTTGDNAVHPHGTHVAGIAAASKNNIGIIGVDPSAKIVSKKVLKSNQSWIGDEFFVEQVVDAVNEGVDVVNMSFWYEDHLMNDAFLAYAYMNNITLVTASGNDYGTKHRSPAKSFKDMIVVGATDINDNLYSKSNRGSYLDLVAPGVDIYSSVTYGNGYDTQSGTSMASPMVAGVASLLKGYKADILNSDIENILKMSADKVPAMNGANFTTSFGNGRLNAGKALKLVGPEYELNNHTATNGSSVSSTDYYTQFFYSSALTGSFLVKKHEVRKTVNLPSHLQNRKVWGNAVTSSGRSNSPVVMDLGYTEIVSQSGNTAVLRSYVYDVYQMNGSILKRLGWYPLAPSEVQFGYSVHGKKDIVNAPSNLTLNYTGNSIDLSWADNSSNEDNFILEYNYTGTWYKKTLTKNTTSHSFPITQTGTYKFRVNAKNSNHTSGYSNTVTYVVTQVNNFAPTLQSVAFNSNSNPKLTWSLVSGATEYRIERAVNNGSYMFLETVSGNTNTYVDLSKVQGSFGEYKTIWYRVKAKKSGEFSVPSNALSIKAKDSEFFEPFSIQDGSSIPSEYGLAQNFPNPFNPNTSITFSVPKSGKIELSIFNSLGKKVKTLVSTYKSPGNYTVNWDATNFSSGIYFYRLITESKVFTKKMTLLK